MTEEMVIVLRLMQECIQDLRGDVENLQGEDAGIQIGNSTFDYMDMAIEKIENKIKKGDAGK